MRLLFATALLSLPFTAIPEVIAAAMDGYENAPRRDLRTIDDVRAVDAETRRFAEGHSRGLTSSEAPPR